MGPDRFDALTRRLSSRRTVLTGLLGGGLATLRELPTVRDSVAVARDRCKRREKRCGGRCIPRRACCTTANCGAGKICVRGACVVGQGTCAAGANACLGAGSCGPAGSDCQCFLTAENKTRCGNNVILGGACSTCVTDANCAADYPQVRGAFCARGSVAGNCPNCNFCMAPCAG